MKTAAPPIPQTDIIRGRSLWQDAWVRLRRNRLAVACLIFLGIISATCFLGSLLCPWEPGRENLQLRSVAPGTVEMVDGVKQTHWLGTDLLGRDLLARTLQGGRVSLMVGFVATLVALIIGVSYGAVAGYFGGRVDDAMMRAVDVLRALPFMIFVILLVTMFGRNLLLIFLAIGAVEWLTMARIVRAQVLGLARQEFVDAARSLGLSTPRIIFRHVIPNVLGPVIVYATLTVPAVMLLEAALSFLSLGVQPPDSSWGTLINDGAKNMESQWWLLAFPAAFFSATLFCLNFSGDGLRDALDVKGSKD